MELRHNTILITGGTSGIGLELAKQLLQLDNTIIVTGRDAVKLEQTKQQFPRIHTFQSDVCDPRAITRLYEQVTNQFPDLNMLINNAGIMLRLNLHNPALDVHNITQEIETNLSGPLRMIQQFLPHLKQQPAAAIMNVTSGISLMPFPLSPVYGATKAGLRSYTQSLRMQLKNTNIKVFDLVAPGANTPLNEKFLQDVDKRMFMEADALVTAAIKGLRKDKLEILPGIARVMKVMSRIAPKFLLKQLSKPLEKMLAQTNHLNAPA